MEIIEIGLSHRQKIVETCFSGYVEVTDNNDDFIIGVEFHEPFYGDGKLFIRLLTDVDDCFIGATIVKIYGPFTSDEIHTGLSICITNFINEVERYVCLQYVVQDGSFSSGEISTRITSLKDPWFVDCSKEIWNVNEWTGNDLNSDPD